jgi:hypothetical protein
MDLAQQVARGGVATHAILLRVTPAHGAPDIAADVGAHVVADARREAVGEDLAVGQLPGLDVAVEYADMRGAPVCEPCVDDVKFLLIGRETEAVRLNEVIDDRLDLPRLAIDAENVVLVLLLVVCPWFPPSREPGSIPETGGRSAPPPVRARRQMVGPVPQENACLLVMSSPIRYAEFQLICSTPLSHVRGEHALLGERRSRQ